MIRFNSRWWCPNTEGVDSFTCDWGAEINWVCSPPYLEPWATRHTARTHARGTLVFPCWPSAPYWLMIYPNGRDTVTFISDLESTCQQVLPGRSGNFLPNCDMLAIQFCFMSPKNCSVINEPLLIGMLSQFIKTSCCFIK